MALDNIKRKSNLDFVSDMKTDIKEGSLSIEDDYLDEHYKMWLQRNGLVHNIDNYHIYLENIKENFSKYDKNEVEEAKKGIDEISKKGMELLASLESAIEKSELKEDSVLNNDSINTNNNNSFNMNSLLCQNFIRGLNKCNSNQELVDYVNSIVEGFNYDENTPTELGAGSMFSGSSYKNGGVYNGFINPNILITNSTLGYSYHIYDRDYLYSFALGLRKMNLSEETNILPYVMKFLDSYFGFPKDNIDRRDDVLYNFAVQHAEEFYKSHNIPIREEMGAIDQMQMSGDFPLSALKGTYSAQCVERSALAQNIMKLCGFNTSIMYGDCESRKEIGGHCWNAISDENNNLYILDFSNTVYSYKNGQFIGREPYSISVSNEQIVSNDGIVEIPDYHYVDGKRVSDNVGRKYAIGKTLNITEELTSGNRLK